ncbi:hypothetical protein KW794_00990 [Candidatus Saccharibacteria bacterium]|nr:hypothetical protein [Candidatus Saccharibacteria bacterium]
MAQNKTNSDDLGSYAAKHPRRMYSGLFLVGTALGASLMAARKNHDKNALQKFMDQLGK